MKKIDIAGALAQFSETWSPRIVGTMNDAHVKVVKIEGEFVWHHHDDTDEMFLVVDGTFDMKYREGGVESVMHLTPGEFVIVPKLLEHCPVASAPCSILLFERAGTVNTGSAGGDLTYEATHL